MKLFPKMSYSVRRTFDFLKMLSKIKSVNKRNAILKEISGDKVLFDSLSELAHNLLKGNIPLKKPQLLKLKRHNKLLNALDCPKTRNIRTNLLRQVEIPRKAKFGDQCVLRYPEPFYYPVVSYEFESI